MQLLLYGQDTCCKCGNITNANSFQQGRTCSHLLCQACLKRHIDTKSKDNRMLLPCLISSCCSLIYKHPKESTFAFGTVSKDIIKCAICTNFLARPNKSSDPYLYHVSCKVSFCIDCASKYIVRQIYTLKLLPLCTKDSIIKVLDFINCPWRLGDEKCKASLYKTERGTVDIISLIKGIVPMCEYSPSPSHCNHCGELNDKTVELDNCRHKICNECIKKAHIIASEYGLCIIKCPVNKCYNVCNKGDFKAYEIGAGIKIEPECKEGPNCTLCQKGKPIIKHECNCRYCEDCILLFYNFQQIVLGGHICKSECHIVQYNKNLLKCLYCEDAFEDDDLIKIGKLLETKNNNLNIG